MLFDCAASSLLLIVLVVSFFFSCSNCGIDGTFSPCVKHGSVTERPTSRLYGVFGFNNFFFILSLSDSLGSSISTDKRLFTADVVAVVGNALDTRRTSPNGVLDWLRISRMRLAVVMGNIAVESATFSEEVDFDRFDGTSLDGTLARCCCEWNADANRFDWAEAPPNVVWPL